MAYSDGVRGSRRLSIIAGVAIVHGAIGYLFFTGMAVQIAGTFVPTLTTTNVPLDPPPPPDPAPPMPRTNTAKAVSTPSLPTAPTTIIDSPASTWTVAIDPGPVTFDPPVIAPPQPTPAPSPSLSAGPKVRGDRTAWFSTDDYPAAAIRAEEQGAVAVSLEIGADGRVTSCRVTASSGSSALDLATCRLYERRGRFTPARGDDGGAIASRFGDRIVWRLPPR